MASPRRPRASARPVRTARQARSRATVAAIVEAAARVLVERGWAGLTTNAVAARAGVSIGSLYEYFRDKQALADALHDRHLTQAEAMADAAEAADRQPPEAAARMLVHGFVAAHADDPALHKVLTSEVPVSALARARAMALDARLTRLMANALAGHVAQPAVSARLLIDAAEALTHRWMVDPDGAPLPPQVLAEELLAMFSAYLAARRPRP